MKRPVLIGSLFALILVSVVATSFGYTIQRPYEWNFQGETWTWTLSVDSKDYEFFKGLPRVDDLSIYVTTPYDDKFLASLANSLEEGAKRAGYDEWDTVNLVISFVQSLPYTSDKATTGYDDYPRYPIETLVDQGGDCEDTAILTAALLRQMGYDVVLLNYPNIHTAVGIAGDETVYGTYYEHNGRRYFYLETTGEGWQIGAMPDELQLPSTATIVDLSPKPLLTFSWKSMPWQWDNNTVTYQVKLTINNYGSFASYDTRCYVAFESNQEGYVWDQRESNASTIDPLAWGTLTFYLKAPREKWTRLSINVWSNNHPEISDQSEWFKP